MPILEELVLGLAEGTWVNGIYLGRFQTRPRLGDDTSPLATQILRLFPSQDQLQAVVEASPNARAAYGVDTGWIIDIYQDGLTCLNLRHIRMYLVQLVVHYSGPKTTGTFGRSWWSFSRSELHWPTYSNDSPTIFSHSKEFIERRNKVTNPLTPKTPTSVSRPTPFRGVDAYGPCSDAETSPPPFLDTPAPAPHPRTTSSTLSSPLDNG